MNTRSRSKKESYLESSELSSPELVGNVTRRIDFDVFSSPETENTPFDGVLQHQALTALETIPQPERRPVATPASNNSANKDYLNSTHSQLKPTEIFNKQVIGNSYTSGEINESFIPAHKFFEEQNRERGTSDYYSGTETPSKLYESTRRLSIAKSSNTYIIYSSDEELEDWWDQPKTDYTYSNSLTYRDSVTPERRIGSPNMSRRGIRGGSGGYISSPDFTHVSPKNVDSICLRSRRIPREDAGLFSDDSDVEESRISSTTSRVNMNKAAATFSSSSFKGSQKVFSSTTTASTVTYGLDVESDVDSDSSSPLLARPVVRRGVISFLKNFNSSAATASLDSRTPSTYSSNGKSNVFAGNHLPFTSTPSSFTTKSTTSRFWEKMNGEAVGSHHEHSFLLMQHGSSWKDKIVTWGSDSWMKIKEKSVAIYTSLLFWLVNIFEAVRHRIMVRKQKSGVKVGGSRWDSTKIFTTVWTFVTTTTIKSTRRAISIATPLQKLFVKYKDKRKENPWLWLWFPLLGFLLISLVGFYLLRDSASSSGEIRSLPVWINEFSVVQSALQIFHLVVGFVVQSTLQIFHLLVGSIIYLLQVLRNYLYIIYEFLAATFFKIFNYLSLWQFSSKSASSSRPVVAHGSESHFETTFYSLLSTISHWWSGATKAMEDGVHSWGVYLANALTVLGSWIAWLSVSVWYFLGKLISALWFILCYCLHSTSSAVYTIGMVPWNYITSVSIPSKSRITPSQNLPPVTITTSQQPIDEDLLEQVLKSPRLLDLIVNTLQAKVDGQRGGISEEHLLSTIRLSVEAEAEKLRSEAISQERISLNHFSDSKAEINLLKDQQERMKNQLGDIKSLLSEMVSRQEADRESTQLREDLQKTLDGISSNLEQLSKSVLLLQERHTDLASQIISCCSNASLTMAEVEERVAVVLADFIGFGPEQTTKSVLSSKLGTFLGDYFTTKEDMQAEVDGLWRRALSQAQQGLSDQESARSEAVDQTIDLVKAAVLPALNEKIESELKMQLQHLNEQLESRVDNGLISETEKRINYLREHVIPEMLEQNLDLQLSDLKIGTEKEMPWMGAILNRTVEQLVKEALLKYDADKTGMVDHALESGGGSIVSTRCTEGYQGHQAELTLLGYSIYRYSTNTPRSIIQPDRNPGQCYAFKGSQGYIVIQFARPVRITGVTMEHIPKVLTPSGSIDSAPRDFSVYGLRTLQMAEEDGFHFGNFVYNEAGEPLQYFDLKNSSEEYFPYVELQVQSNHGNMQYTCLYRFRVHGEQELE